MGKRERTNENLVRLDLSELDINSVLLEDLRHYVGSPKLYVPKIWDVCVSVLREENRIVLNEQDNGEALDRVWEEFYDEFSERRFKKIISENRLSVRMDSYRDSVAHFYFDIFEILYPQIAKAVDIFIRRNKNASLTTYSCKVVEVMSDYYNDGFGELKIENGVVVEVIAENMLTTKLLLGDGYGF